MSQDTVTLEMVGLTRQRVQTQLLRVEGDVAIVKGYVMPEVRFSLIDGRCLEGDWDFWRLSELDREILKVRKL